MENILISLLAAYSMHLYSSRLMKELDLSQDVEQRMIEAAQCLLVSLQNLTMIDEENRWLLDSGKFGAC
jgi:hypothetical protein